MEIATRYKVVKAIVGGKLAEYCQLCLEIIFARDEVGSKVMSDIFLQC